MSNFTLKTLGVPGGRLTPFFLLVGACLLSHCSAAQFYQKLLSNETDSMYITRLNELLTIKFISTQNLDALILTYGQNDITYRSVSKLNLGAGFNYRGIGFSATYGFSAANPGSSLSHSARQWDFNLSINKRKFFLLGTYRNLGGYYYRENVQGLWWWEEDNPPNFREDIKTNELSLNLVFIKNHLRYSSRAFNTLDEAQRKSAGSFLYGGYARSFTMSSTGNLDFGKTPTSPDFDLLSGRYTGFGGQAGYGHTFVMKHRYFINLTLLLGIGMRHIRESLTVFSNTRDLWDAEISAISGIAMGYNSHKWAVVMKGEFFGFSLKGNEDASLQKDAALLKLIVAKRFELVK